MDQQLMKVINIYQTFNLLQVNHIPTRDKKTLNVLFTNAMALFINTRVNKTSISYHNITEVTTTFNSDIEEKCFGSEKDDVNLSDQNFHCDKTD